MRGQGKLCKRAFGRLRARANGASGRLTWQDAAMLRFCLLGAGCLLLAGCSDSSAAAKPSDGVLVLEVGGIDTSLRKSLTDAGIEVGAAQALAPVVPEPPPEPAPSPQGGSSATQGEPAPPVPEPKQEPAPPSTGADWFEVELAPKQTLTGLAKKHLGDGTRYPEILKLNGWTERDVLRLRPGAKVKIPKQKR